MHTRSVEPTSVATVEQSTGTVSTITVGLVLGLVVVGLVLAAGPLTPYAVATEKYWGVAQTLSTDAGLVRGVVGGVGAGRAHP